MPKIFGLNIAGASNRGDNQGNGFGLFGAENRWGLPDDELEKEGDQKSYQSPEVSAIGDDEVIDAREPEQQETTGSAVDAAQTADSDWFDNAPAMHAGGNGLAIAAAAPLDLLEQMPVDDAFSMAGLNWTVPDVSTSDRIAYRDDDHGSASRDHPLPAANPSEGSGQASVEAAPSTLGELADFLATGYWGGSSHQFNLSDSGTNANSGELFYKLDGFSGQRGYTDIDGISAARAALVDEAFKLYGEVLGITFTRVSQSYIDSSLVNINDVDFFFTDNDSGAYASTSWNSGWISNTIINIATSWSGSTSTYDDYTLQTIFHEIGHALGLGHQGDYNGSASYPNDANFENDSWQASMMSYFSQTENTSIIANYELLQTPMSVDWMALEQLYGGQTYGSTTYGVQNAFLGDTIYGFNTNISSSVSDIWAEFDTYGDQTASTIIDAGGIDTLDLSGYSANQNINLRVTQETDTQASVSDIGGSVGNLTLAEGTVIEHAKGGSGNDTFWGNSADNHFWGNGGNDTFVDSLGNDIYRGGGGSSDTVSFSGLLADFAFELSGSFIKVATSIGNAVFDLVENTVEWFTFSDETRSYSQIEDLVGNELPTVAITSATDDQGSVQGPLNNGDDTDDTAPVLSGTLSDPLSGAQTVEVYRDGVSIGGAAVVGTSWTFADTGLVEGSYAYTARVEDGGTLGATSPSFLLTVDTTPPAVTVDALTTNDATPVLTGTVDDTGATVMVTVDGGTAQLATVSGNIWSLEILTPLAEGTFEVVATATDAVGNSASDSSSNELAIDLTPPVVAPTITPVGLTNDATPELAGTATLAAGETLSVTIDGVTYDNVTVELSGDWTQEATAGVGDGTYDVTAIVTDAAGNETSSTETGAVTVDTTAPVVTVDALTTNDETPLLTGTVDDTGATVMVTVNGGAPQLATVSGNTWSLLLNPGPGEGTWDVVATATDLAGNVGNDSSSGELVIDLTAPSAPSVDTLATGDSTPIITGSATLAAGETLTVEVDGQVYYNVAVDSSDSWSVQLLTSLSDGTYDVIATVTDAAGNSTTDNTGPTELTVDSTIGADLYGTASGSETLVGTDGNDTIGGLEQDSSASGKGTKDVLTGNGGDDLFILGTADTQYYDDGNDKSRNNGKNDYARVTDFGNGADVVQLNGTGYLLIENYSVDGFTGLGIFADTDGGGFGSRDELVGLLQGVSLADVQENYNGAVTTLSLTGGPDTTPPVVTVDTLQTPDTTPELTGTVNDPTATIAVLVAGNLYDATNNGDGTWTLADDTIAPVLSVASYDVSVTATDGAGNVGNDGTTGELEIINDTTPPVVTVNPLQTSDTTPELTGTVDDAAAAVEVMVDGSSYNATNNQDGTWTLADNTFAELPLGTYDIGVTATDGAGNAGSDNSTDELTIVADPVNQDYYGTDLSEIVTGDAGDNIISGLPETGSSNWGAGTVDTLIGDAGMDTFLLGETGQRYYDDGKAKPKNNGTNDYGKILDFEDLVDTIQLAGSELERFR